MAHAVHACWQGRRCPEQLLKILWNETFNVMGISEEHKNNFTLKSLFMSKDKEYF